MNHRAMLLLLMLLLAITLNSHSAEKKPDPSTAASRPAHSGIYALWYIDKEKAVLDDPWVAGGQVYLMWHDLEPKEGVYDFRLLEQKLAELKGKGLGATVQVDGNHKPDWLFTRVPYLPEKLHKQVGDHLGTLMYWHENYRKAYCDFVRAFGEEMKKSPNRSALIGVRLNYNAIGTELTAVPPEKRPLNLWTVPPGVKPGPEYTDQLADQYEDTVVQTFIDAFIPDIFVFCRSNLNVESAKKIKPLVQEGKIGWFHTSARAEQPNAVEAAMRCQIYLDDCKPGTTLGYTESSNETYAPNRRPFCPCTPPQWNYWRCLNQLHCGISFVGTYVMDLTVAHDGTSRGGKDYHQWKDEYRKAYEFTAKYAGYHADPKESPGAWIALRDAAHVKGDYTFLMSRLPDESTVVTDVGPKDVRYGAWARVLAPGGKPMQLVLNDAFAQSLAGAHPSLNVIYLDNGNGHVEITVAGRTLGIDCQNSGTWKTATLAFAGEQLRKNSVGAQIVLQAKGAPVTLHMIEVTRKDASSPEK